MQNDKRYYHVVENSCRTNQTYGFLNIRTEVDQCLCGLPLRLRGEINRIKKLKFVLGYVVLIVQLPMYSK